MKSLVTLITVLILHYPAAAAVVINELMINEPGSETALEWIELFNADSIPANLGEYALIEGGDTTRFKDTLTISGCGFAVLCRKAVSTDGSASFESIWGNGSGIWGDAAIEDYPLLEAKFSLRNSGDTVTLVSISSGSSETVVWATSPPDGIALERINPFKRAISDNFGYSVALSGSTPGRVNSLIPPDYDLGILLDSTTLDVPQDTTAPVTLTICIRNRGLKPFPSSHVIVYFDRDFSNSLTASDALDSVLLPDIAVDSQLTSRREYYEPVGRKRLRLQLSPDADSSNNSHQFDFAFGDFFTELVINEFLANPSDRLDCEWVELLNRVSYPVHLDGFKLGDLTLRYRMTSGLVVEPGARIIVCEDTASMIAYYGELSCPVVQPADWNRLDNSGDLILLENDLGAISDSVRFDRGLPEDVSWERDEDSTSGSFAAIFYPCTDTSHATPCRSNSERLLPPMNDIGFAENGIMIKASTASAPVEIAIKIRNYGLVTSMLSTLKIYHDDDFDATPEEEEILIQSFVQPISPGDSLTMIFSRALSQGHYQIICLLESDDDESNNIASGRFSVGPWTREIVITEFLANPAGTLESEWLEARNLSDRSIDLADWFVGDSLHQHQIAKHIIVAPQQYFIIAQDSLSFVGRYGERCSVVQPSSWSSLNNTGDAIVLIDDCGVVSDSLTYRQTGEDNQSVELNERTLAGARGWYVSTAAEGATPCQANSVTGEVTSGISVALLNRVFSPRLGEQLHYRLTCPPATVFTIEVFDLGGRRQRTIAQSQPFSTGEFVYSGESDNYGTLPVGAYVLKIKTEQGFDYEEKFGFAVAGSK